MSSGSKPARKRSGVRIRANKAKEFRCKNLICVLEGPNILANIGSVIRNVDVLGISKIYIVDWRKKIPHDWKTKGRFNTTLNTVSVGTAKWVYYKHFESTRECIEHLAKKGVVSICTSPYVKGAHNVELTQGNYTKYKQLAVWFGNESQGISEEAVRACQLCVQIPMCGMGESLNLATCTGIVLHHIATQRRAFSRARFQRKLALKEFRKLCKEKALARKKLLEQ